MSKKSTKAKAPKASSKAKAKKGNSAPQVEATNAAETTASEAPTTEVPEATTPTADFQIKKDAKGRFWVVAKDGTEHGPFDTKKEATDAKAALASGATPTPAVDETKPASAKKVKEPKPKKVSAIDAAAQVLAGSKDPMNCMALVEAMATQGLWESPGGATPHATLYSAIIREIANKGVESRFVKKDRGMFAKA